MSVLPSPGLASILVFQEKCQFSIMADKSGSDKYVKKLTIAILKETQKQGCSVYRQRMDKDTANEGLISTLSLLLTELTHVNWYAFLFFFYYYFAFIQQD